MNLFKYIYYLFNYYLISQFNFTKSESRPNIIVIVADDMGWNDFSFHGSNEIPTPNIDALAYSGIILNRHYTLPTCTPSRAAFLTGRHPIRMGLQGLPMNVAEPRGMPLREKILPEYLKKLGYTTRLVGKWHLGYYTNMHTPAQRGFDSFIGYYGGYIRYFNHVVTKDKHTGIDLHNDTIDKIKPYQNDKYFTDFVSDQSEDIIKNHDKKTPLYLHISHVASHASENLNPIEVRNMTEVNKTLGYIPDINRRRYAGVATALDESVGRVIKALKEADMLKNSIIVFMSDNGAPTDVAPFTNYGSNYPLRGMKSSLLEGGVRVPAIFFSSLLKNQSRISEEYFHVTDWLPTLYRFAGGDLSELKDIDGIDQSLTIAIAAKSKRDSIFLNIDEVLGPESAIIGRHKLVKGIVTYTDYYGKDGNDHSPEYDIETVLQSMAGEAINGLSGNMLATKERIIELRDKAGIECKYRSGHPDCTATCLFDIFEDPCESKDISEEHRWEVTILNSFLDSYRAVLVSQTNTYIDPAGYPENFGGYWMPWMDYEYTPPRDRNKSAIWTPFVFCEGFPMDDPRNCL